MKFEKDYVDGNGKRFTATVVIAESGLALERAVTRLANRARGKSTLRATALGGVMTVTVRELGKTKEKS
jgi:hypothetical protein